uniref:Uncharacterized protein n=1 Tax=Rhizophora mucronata TaxID=61149 RepID=A0A2P2R5D8_RHIMU
MSLTIEQDYLQKKKTSVKKK